MTKLPEEYSKLAERLAEKQFSRPPFHALCSVAFVQGFAAAWDIAKTVGEVEMRQGIIDLLEMGQAEPQTLNYVKCNTQNIESHLAKLLEAAVEYLTTKEKI